MSPASDLEASVLVKESIIIVYGRLVNNASLHSGSHVADAVSGHPHPALFCSVASLGHRSQIFLSTARRS